jgi:hypothetical protein
MMFLVWPSPYLTIRLVFAILLRWEFVSFFGACSPKKRRSKEVFLVRHGFHSYFEWGLPGGWLKKNEARQAGLR